jgi:hypothetical protein
VTAPRDVLTPSEIEAIVNALGDSFGAIEAEMAQAFGDLVGRIVINRVIGCRAYFGHGKGWCGRPRNGDDMYCLTHLNEIEKWKQEMLELRERQG